MLSTTQELLEQQNISKQQQKSYGKKPSKLW